MQWFHDLTIGRRLHLSFGVLLALLAVVAGVGLWAGEGAEEATWGMLHLKLNETAGQAGSSPTRR